MIILFFHLLCNIAKLLVPCLTELPKLDFSFRTNTTKMSLMMSMLACPTAMEQGANRMTCHQSIHMIALTLMYSLAEPLLGIVQFQMLILLSEIAIPLIVIFITFLWKLKFCQRKCICLFKLFFYKKMFLKDSHGFKFWHVNINILGSPYVWQKK